MPNLVKDILLVASPYDRFILEEDGRFSDRLLSQYVEMDLSGPPRFDHVSSGKEALARLRSGTYDLVLTTPHFADMRPLQLAAKVSDRSPETPVAMLTYDQPDAQIYSQHPRNGGLAQVFLWTGDPKLLVTLVKSVEDLLNVDDDTERGLVRVIIVVEDSPSFYSSYLPLIYSEVLAQVEGLLAERLHERDRRYRRRARPKILLARNYEEAVDFFDRYHEYLLGTICDMCFPRKHHQDEQAGLDFIKLVRERQPDVPVLLQSRDASQAALAEELSIQFADKNSKELLSQLRRFIRNNFGFGAFVFQVPGQPPEGQAEDMWEMVRALDAVSDEVLHYHAERNHISNWLMARSEFALALEFRPKKVSDFKTTDELRQYLIDVFSSFLRSRQKGEITEFARGQDALDRDFTRLGTGSMGGKARSNAFVSQLLAGNPLQERFPDVQILVPRTVVLCTDIFEQFCRSNGLLERVLDTEDDEEVVRLFLEQPLPPELLGDLESILDQARYPLAVRSSSLHEDSESQPLAGLYKTFMLPNCASSEELRLEQLTKCIRLIWASTFLSSTRNYMAGAGLRVEEERMAVIIQQLVGRRHGDRFYPDFAGVAQSYNYYPIGAMEPEDGIVTVALGLGQTIVEGRRALRFCPSLPEVLPQMPSTQAALRNSQREFYALDLSNPDFQPEIDDAATLVKLGLEVAEADGTLEALGATYSPDNDQIYDTIYREGVRLVNFAGILRHGRMPLAGLLQDLLRLGKEGMGTEVEMEFAVDLGEGDRPPQLAVLQLRPLVTETQGREVDLRDSAALRRPLISGPALGNGVIDGIRDVVYVHPKTFDLAKSKELARKIARINRHLEQEGRPYLLIGPGRWGTADHFLGIPVDWRDVAGAKAIVELEVPRLAIDPSQGTHFFHNLTSQRIGYFNLNLGDEDQVFDLDYLDSLEAESGDDVLRHVCLPHRLEIHIDGRIRKGLVLLGE